MCPRSKKIAEMMRGKTRKSILLAAIELFAKNGYSSTTADAIARKAGISKGLIFNHFKTKEDILFALFDEQYELIMPRFFLEHDSRPPKERIVALIDAWLDLIKSEPLLVRLSLRLNLDDQYRKLIRSKKAMEFFDKFVAQMKSVLKEAGSDNPELDTYLFMFFFDGIVANYTVAPELFPIDAIKERMVRLLTGRWKGVD